MSARKQLPGLLHQWREQTRRETDALRRQDWTAVWACQHAKGQLRALIDQETSAGGDLPPSLRPVVQEVIAAERQNIEWLGQQMKELQQQRLELEDSSRNLKRMRATYAHPQKHCWHSYG